MWNPDNAIKTDWYVLEFSIRANWQIHSLTKKESFLEKLAHLLFNIVCSYHLYTMSCVGGADTLEFVVNNCMDTFLENTLLCGNV